MALIIQRKGNLVDFEGGGGKNYVLLDRGAA